MAKLTAYNRGDGNIALFNLSEADSIQSIFLGGAGVETLVRPAAARSVLMRADGAFFYKIDGNPAVPTNEVTSGGSIYMPADSWEGDVWYPVTGGLAALPTDLRFIRKGSDDVIITLLFFNG